MADTPIAPWDDKKNYLSNLMMTMSPLVVDKDSASSEDGLQPPIVPHSITLRLKNPGDAKFHDFVVHTYRPTTRKTFADPLNSGFFFKALGLLDVDGEVKTSRIFWRPCDIAQALVVGMAESGEAPKKKRGRPPKGTPPAPPVDPTQKAQKCDVGKIMYSLFPPDIIRQWRQKWSELHESLWSEVNWDNDESVGVFMNNMNTRAQKAEVAKARTQASNGKNKRSGGDESSSVDATPVKKSRKKAKNVEVPEEEAEEEPERDAEFDIPAVIFAAAPPPVATPPPAAPLRHPGASSKSLAAAKHSSTTLMEVVNNLDASDSDSSSEEDQSDFPPVLAKRATQHSIQSSTATHANGVTSDSFGFVFANPSAEKPNDASTSSTSSAVGFGFNQTQKKVVMRSSLGVPIAAPTTTAATTAPLPPPAATTSQKKRKGNVESLLAETTNDVTHSNKKVMMEEPNDETVHSLWTSVKKVLTDQGEFMGRLAKLFMNNKSQLDDVVAKGIMSASQLEVPSSSNHPH